MKFFGLCLTTLVLLSCGTYRSGSSQGYRGMGDFKSPSSYSKGVDSQDFTDSEERSVRGQITRANPYYPKNPFKLSWPVSPVHINRGFKPDSDPYHEGIDLGGHRDMDITAAHEGVVIYVGNQFHGYGNMVMVEYNKEWATLYGHLDTFSVKQGEIVQAGDAIGGMGSTGHATGVHLHFELLHFAVPVDPIKLLTRPVKFAKKSGSRKNPLYSRRMSSKPRS